MDKASPPANLVVTYHYVRPENSDGVVGITPRAFDRHLRAIARRYEIVTSAQFVANERTTQGLALITFDDAVRDQFDHAFPILEAHDAPAVFFAPMRPFDPALASRPSERWIPQHLLHALAQELGWDGLEARIRPAIERRLRALHGDARLDEDRMNRLYHYEQPRKRWLKFALAFCLDGADSAACLTEVNRSVGLHAEDWFVTTDQLVAMQDAGHTIGGHGYAHLAYTTMSPKAQAGDLHRAARVMNHLLTPMPRPLAYPFGSFTDATEPIARSAGFTRCFTTADRVDARDVPTILPDAACEPATSTPTPTTIRSGAA